MIKTIVNYVNFYYGGIASPQNPPANLLDKYSEDIIKTALVYRFLYEHYVIDTLPLETIIYKLDYLPIKSNSRVIRNHLIFHRAFKSFRKHYKAGRWGDCIPPKPPCWLGNVENLEVYQYLTGILYWLFHRGFEPLR